MFLLIEKRDGTVVPKRIEIGYKTVGLRINGFVVENQEELNKLLQSPEWVYKNLIHSFKVRPRKLVDIVCTYQHNHSDPH